MSFKNGSFLQSLRNAYRGIELSFQSERNIKIQLGLMVLVVVLGLALDLYYMEWIIIILASTFVLGTEMLNTAIETTIDMICHEDFHPLAKKVKDIAAGAVLIASIGALIIGCIIILPKVIKFIK